MIAPAWAHAMARYNSEMNRRTFRAAGGLDEARRREDGGAFFGSIHATLSHLMWADAVWMHRFAGWDAPPGGIPGSTTLWPAWEALREARVLLDARIEEWARGVPESWLASALTWTNSRGLVNTQPAWLLVTHLFNHQAHHRGQVHALLTRFGAEVEATDLPWVIAL